MYAVVETGGKQYRVAPGDVIHVETLAGEVGSSLELDGVKAVVDGSNIVSGSQAATARIRATVTGHGRDSKVIVFKFKRKKQYKRTIGHRQNYTQVKINEVVL